MNKYLNIMLKCHHLVSPTHPTSSIDEGCNISHASGCITIFLFTLILYKITKVFGLLLFVTSYSIVLQTGAMQA